MFPWITQGNRLLWFMSIILLSVRSKPSLAYSGDICGTTSFIDSSGTIGFPNVGEISENSVCNYRIVVGDDNFVSLRFQKFDVPTYLDFCDGSWMTISCVSNEISGTVTSKSPKLCGETKWSSTLKLYYCPVLSLELRYNRLDISSGAFALKYEIVPLSVAGNNSDTGELSDVESVDCGQTFFTNRSGVIALPYSRNITRIGVNCTYTISTGEPDSVMSSLTLNVTFLDLLTLVDELNGCVQDRLQIICTDSNGRHLSDTNCETFSSDSLANPTYFRCLNLEITIQSDAFDPRDTRQIEYDMIVEDENYYDDDYDYETPTGDRNHGRNSNCGDPVYTERVGFVTSPHFPLAHPHELNCTYRIVVGRKNSLGLRFLTFDLEGDNSVGYCNYDWLTISCVLNGTSTTSPSTLRKLCGQIRWTSELRYSTCTFVVLRFRSDHSVAKGGFRIQYTITKNSLNFPGISCRRTEFNESDGIIALPYDPSGYVRRINCVYVVNANSSSIFALDMKAFNWARLRQDMGNCIQFYCEGEKTWNFSSCLHFAGQMNRTLFFHRCQKLRLSVFSEFFDYSQEYRIPFKVISSDGLCGNTSFSRSNGAIFLPNISAPPNLEQNCTFSITGGINTTISISSVETRFQYLYLRHQIVCRDRVTMTCLQSPNFNPYSGKRLCTQKKLPSTVRFFNCSVLTVAFEFGDVASAMKFRLLNYTVTRTENGHKPENLPELRCDVQSPAGTLSRSIRLPVQSSYSVPLVSFNCTHNADVMGIRKGLISVDFSQVAPVFEPTQDCRQDNVMISCMSSVKTTANINSTKSLTFCGGRIPTMPTVFSFTDCGHIQFTLRSRSYYPNEPRSLSYRISSDECGNTSFVSSSGYITSPRFPLSYPIASNCFYNIEVGDRKVITLRSLTFQLPGRSQERLGTRSPDDDFKFGADHRYTSYSRYDSCNGDWLDFRCISNGSSTAPYDGLTNQMLCGSTRFNTTLYGCQTLRLNFVASSEVRSTTGTGFNIHYDIKDTENSDATCSGDTYFNDSSGTIAYPGKRRFYPNGMNCNYVITAGRSNSVVLKFLYLSSQHGTHVRDYESRNNYYDSCYREWMQIGCSPGQSAALGDRLKNRKFCGDQQAFTVLLDGCRHVNVTFISNSTISSQGFQFRYEVLPAGEECGIREFANATGVITSPAFPSPYPHRANCSYNIEVGSGNSLYLQFLVFDVGHHRYSTYNGYGYSCPNDYVKITCISRDSEDQAIANQYLDSRLCGFKSLFSTTLYECSRYALEFVSTGIYSKRGFQLLYTISTMDEKCGNRIFSNKTGIVAFPWSQGSYARQFYCTYNIEAGANRTLSLQFLAFNIGTNIYRPPCTTDWVKILCLSRDSDELVSTAPDFNRELCGRKSPFNVTLTGCNRAAVKLSVSRGILSETGFMIRYVISERSYCGYPSTTFTNAKGVIMSPDLAMEQMPKNISCTYFISAQQMSAISVAIAAIHRQECDSSWLSIRCLKNDEVSDSSLKLCEKRISYQEVVFPSCSLVQLIYRSANYEASFFVLYAIKGIEEVCGQSLFTKPSGVISFPRFSSNYVTDFNCSYSILVGNYSAILVNLSSLTDAVKINNTCSGDWIAIVCRNGKRNNRYTITHGECNNQLEKRISISLQNCSTADIVFHSRNPDPGRFFQLSYELVHSTPATEKSVVMTTSLPSIATDRRRPSECPVHSNWTSCKCPDDQSGQTTVYTEEPAYTHTSKGVLASLDSGPETGSSVGSKSFGVLVACVVLLLLLLLFVASVVTVVVWRRKRKRNEDETTLICDDGRRDNFNSRENPVFSPFSSQEEHQSDANCYVHLESMASNLS